MDSIENLHIGNMLKMHIRKNRYFQSALARDLGISEKSVGLYKKRKTMQVDTLIAISRALKYNFLRDIADLLPPDMPPQKTHALQARIDALENENEHLKVQITTLEKALSLVGGR